MCWARHWQCNTEKQDLKDKLWGNEEPEPLEEGLLGLNEADSEKATINYKGSSGSGMGWIPHPKFFWICQKNREEKRWNALRRWKVCTTMFLLIPNNVASERPHHACAHHNSLVRRVDATKEGRSGGVERSEALLDMERFEGSTTLVLDLAKALERVGFPVMWAWATHFDFSRKILRVLCGYFEFQRLVQILGCVAGPLQTITAIFLGSKWSCLL